jgi:hypothetical protein
MNFRSIVNLLRICHKAQDWAKNSSHSHLREAPAKLERI